MHNATMSIEIVGVELYICGWKQPFNSGVTLASPSGHSTALSQLSSGATNDLSVSLDSWTHAVLILLGFSAGIDTVDGSEQSDCYRVPGSFYL